MRTPRSALPCLLSLLALLAAAAVPVGITAEPPAAAASSWRLPAAARVVALSDLHGEADDLAALLDAAGLAGKKGEWTGGRAHLVVVGDLLGYGPDERGVLDLLMRLEREAAAAGGGVHVVLGQHEALALAADPRRVTAQACAAFVPEEPRALREAAAAAYAARRPAPKAPFDEAFPPGWFGRRVAFGPSGRYGEWLLARPSAIVVDGTLFVHAGPSPLFARLGGPGPLNERIAADLRALTGARAELETMGLADPTTTTVELLEQVERRVEARGAELGAAGVARARALLDQAALALAGPVFAADGPLWYMRTARAPEAEERETFEAGLRAAGAERAVIGHLPTPDAAITTRFGGRLFRVSTGLPADLFRGAPAALEITKDGARVIVPGAPARTPPTPEPAAAASPEALAARDRALEEFLLTAEIVKIEEVGVGVTKPRRVTLGKDGVTRRAVFKSIDEEVSDRVRLGENNTELSFSDRYVYEVAAYRLDRLLGMRMVPVTVTREVDGQMGSLQLWIEHAIDEGRRLKYRLEPDDAALSARQRDTMLAFDVLIYNVDRNLGNILYTFGDGGMHLVDHSRAFRLNRGRPRALKGVVFEIEPALAAALRALDRPRLESVLKGVLSREQMKAVLARRDEILKTP